MNIRRKSILIFLMVLLLVYLLLHIIFPPEYADHPYSKRAPHYKYSSTMPMGNGAYYGTTSWSGAHRDSRNSDYIPLVSPAKVKRTWSVLKGKGFFMPPTIGGEGNIYATTSGGRGHSHLHAFDNQGNLLWKANPMQSKSDLDSAAYFSAPVVDIDNNIYVPDSNQLWSYDNQGNVRWVVDLNAHGIYGYTFSAFFTHRGLVGIIASDGKVALFLRGSGQLARPILDLPGVKGMPATPMPPGLLANGLIDPELQKDNWSAIWGFDMEVANTPSVHPLTGRIFIVATGRKAEETVIYGIDVTETGLVIAFETNLGKYGSGTSPTLSFDGKYVYVIDGRGYLTGIRTRDGVIAWRSKERSVAGVSSSTMPDGKVFTFHFNQLICWNGSNGERIWVKDMNVLADKSVGWLPKQYGNPQVDIVSGLTTTVDGLWFVVKAGVEIPLTKEQQAQAQPPVAGLPVDTFKQPTQHYLVHTDYNGNIKHVTDFVDDGALVIMGLDGRIYVTTLGVSTSIAYYGVNPRMPIFMRNTSRPYGGLVAFEPDSFFDYFIKVAKWNSSMIDEYDRTVEDEKRERLLMQLKASLSSIHLSLIEAKANKEISEEKYTQINASVATLYADTFEKFAEMQLGVAQRVLKQIIDMATNVKS